MPLIPSLRMRGRYHPGLQKEFKVSLGYKVRPCLVGVSAATTASGVTMSRKQEGSSVQLLGAWPWVVYFRHLSTAQFGKTFLMIISSVLCTQQSLRCDYVETLCKACVCDIFYKDGFSRLTRSLTEDPVWSMATKIVKNVTNVLTMSTPSLIGRWQVMHSLLWRNSPVCLPFLVPLVLTCGHKDLCMSHTV